MQTIQDEKANRRGYDEKIWNQFSTLRRITRSQKARAMNYRTDIISTYLEWLHSDHVISFINSFIKRNKTSFTSVDICVQIKEELHIKIKPHVVRRVLKEKFLWSYKKGSGRPSNLDVEKQKWLKAIFVFICWIIWIHSD